MNKHQLYLVSLHHALGTHGFTDSSDIQAALFPSADLQGTLRTCLKNAFFKHVLYDKV
jgi:hypothetical protein